MRWRGAGVTIKASSLHKVSGAELYTDTHIVTAASCQVPSVPNTTAANRLAYCQTRRHGLEVVVVTRWWSEVDKWLLTITNSSVSVVTKTPGSVTRISGDFLFPPRLQQHSQLARLLRNSSWGMKLTAWLHLILRLRMYGAIQPLPENPSYSCSLAQRQLFFLLK